MCFGSKAPPPLPPDPVKPQAAKAPDVNAIYRNRKQNGAGPMAGGGTLLTSPSGIANNTLTTGKTLLGA